MKSIFVGGGGFQSCGQHFGMWLYSQQIIHLRSWANVLPLLEKEKSADIHCHLSKYETTIQTLKQKPNLQSFTYCSPW